MLFGGVVGAKGTVGAEDSQTDDTTWHDFTTSPDYNEPVATNAAQPFPSASPKFSAVVPSAQQPVGALSGRVVFMNSGHGWTWNTNNFWYLQRPAALNSMNEDYGNLDQLNFFAAYCFNAGAIVASMRPLGQQTNEVVLDNVSPAVTFAGPWADTASTIYYGNVGAVPYRSATLSATETATATYTPTIPVAGYYPVYTWVRHGSDRGNQLYRIRHTGGESLYRVPHYLVGNGWVYLGEYYFNAGSNSLNGAVVISNLRGSTMARRSSPMRSVSATAWVRSIVAAAFPVIRANRKAVVTGSRRVLARGRAHRFTTPAALMSRDSWSAPPRMSVEMTETAGTSFYKRIHLSFHSNAGGSRGTVGLITTVPTPNQAALAQICGSSVNNELVGIGSPPLEYPWYDRGSGITFSGGYSEISNNNFVNVMDGTIIEVAYHDDATDAALLRDPRARGAVARAAMHGVVKYMNQFDTNNPPPLIFLPEPPTNPSAVGAVDGSVALAWAAPVSVANSGAPTNYVIYQSTNGYGFGNPISVGNVTSFTITNLTAGVDYYFRVTAANVGGESFPSAVVGCRPPMFADSAKVLVVNAFDRFDRTTDLKQNLVAQNYVPPGGGGATDRVLPRRINSFDYVVQHGKAISAAGVAFDSCHHAAITSDLVALTNYPVVIWACGNESTADETFSSAEQTKVAAYLAGGGNLFVSGSEIAWDLDRPSGPTTADRNFIHNQLHAAYVADSSGVWNFNGVVSSIFSNNPNGTFDNGSQGIYLVGFPDVIAPSGGGTISAVSYSNVVSGAAGTIYNGSLGGGKVIYLGFPFETILDAGVRRAYMADALNFFNVQPLKFESIALQTDNQVKLMMSGLTGTYTLQTATTLGEWSSLVNLTNTTAYLNSPIALQTLKRPFIVSSLSRDR